MVNLSPYFICISLGDERSGTNVRVPRETFKGCREC